MRVSPSPLRVLLATSDIRITDPDVGDLLAKAFFKSLQAQKCGVPLKSLHIILDMRTEEIVKIYRTPGTADWYTRISWTCQPSERDDSPEDILVTVADLKADAVREERKDMQPGSQGWAASEEEERAVSMQGMVRSYLLAQQGAASAP